MQNGVISDGQISASSQADQQHRAELSRLHLQGKNWVPRSNDQHPWLQIDLGTPINVVTAVATQGRQLYPRWVRTYRVAYSDDAVNFQLYTEQGQNQSKVKLKCITTWLMFVSSLRRKRFRWDYVRFLLFDRAGIGTRAKETEVNKQTMRKTPTETIASQASLYPI